MEGKMIRGFCHYSRAWYTIPKEKPADEVMFGMYDEEGYTDGEMAVRWHNLGGKLEPRLEVYDDGWAKLWEFRDVIEKMAQCNDRGISPEEFCNLLKGCGFKDLTLVERDEPDIIEIAI